MTTQNVPAAPSEPYLRFFAFGGLGEVGMNCAVFEADGDLLIFDCGVNFPDGDHFGIDTIIPDFTYLVENADRIVGLLLTHGHQDHIGAVPQLLRELDVPVFAPRFALELIDAALSEHPDVTSVELNEIFAGDRLQLGAFDLEFIHVNHSIPDTVSVVLRTKVGTFVHTADFKIDYRATGEATTDLGRFAAVGKEGVRGLFIDSTNAEVPGQSGSEADVRARIMELIRHAPSRVLMTMFSSNMYRVQALLDAAHETGRRLLLLGRSLQKTTGIARDTRLLSMPSDGLIVDFNEARSLPGKKLIVALTGSQGEPRAALTRIALGDYRGFELEPDDQVIFSARTIPGNERSINNVLDHLARRGIRVHKGGGVHVSGHAYREELRLIHALVQPQEVIPVHGDHRFLQEHAAMAHASGIETTHVLDNGDILEFTADETNVVGHVEARRIVVDGGPLGAIDGTAIRNRRRLARMGLCIVWTAVDAERGEIAEGPILLNRGAVSDSESDEVVLDAAQQAAEAAFDDLADDARRDKGEVSEAIRIAVRRIFRRHTSRKPVVESIVYFV